MRQILARHAATTNDVYSYKREVLEGGCKFNVLTILMKEQHLSLTQVVDTSVKMLNEMAIQFEWLAAQLVQESENLDSRDMLAQYVDHMRQFCTGNVILSRNSPGQVSDPLSLPRSMYETLVFDWPTLVVCYLGSTDTLVYWKYS